MRAAAWIALGLASVSAVAVAAAIHHVNNPPPTVVVEHAPTTDGPELQALRQLWLQGQRDKFESDTSWMKVSHGYHLLRSSIATILCAEGKGKRIPMLHEMSGPEAPPDESDPVRATDCPMTILTWHYSYTFKRGEFPEFAEANDMLWQMMMGGGDIPEFSPLPESLVTRILARADQAIALLNPPAAVK